MKKKLLSEAQETRTCKVSGRAPIRKSRTLGSIGMPPKEWYADCRFDAHWCSHHFNHGAEKIVGNVFETQRSPRAASATGAAVHKIVDCRLRERRHPDMWVAVDTTTTRGTGNIGIQR